jgi:hypothetical protein
MLPKKIANNIQNELWFVYTKAKKILCSFNHLKYLLRNVFARLFSVLLLNV